MSWSWRKRKIIIPGVRMNFSKNGISTTIGPRGLGLTMGPKGTYLNTSIPGTGLYKRTKLGGNNTSQTMKNNTNIGCGTILLALTGGIVWLFIVILIGIAFVAYDCSYWWLGLIFTVVTITTHILVKKSMHSKSRREEQIQQPHIEAIPSVSNTSIPPIKTNEITEEYFNDINLMVALLMKDYTDILNIKEVDTLLDSLGMVYNLDGTNITNCSTKLNMLYWLDMTRCYLGINNQIDLNDKTGLGLFTIIVETLGGKIRNLDQLAQSRSYFQTNVEKIVRSIKDLLETEKRISKNEFSVAKMLEDYPDLRDKYVTHLYRFASIAVKADNVITEEEADWLVNIIQQKSSSVSSIKKEEISIEDAIETSKLSPKRIPSISAKNELKNLIGLASVKEEVETLTNFIKVQQARAAKGIKTASASYHCVFTGNPGTGKTTVARILAKIYKQLGVVSKGHLVETDRAGLVAEYVGQTAVKTNKIIDSALDGVLFIDEAYSLVQGGQSDYGKEAIATLLKRMEDDRDRLIVIIAGYTKEMKDFIDANPGLQSRFNRYIEFPDYSAEDLLLIFTKHAQKCEYKISDEAKAMLKTYFEDKVAHKDKNFGNGRFARNIFEKAMELQANRLAREVSLTSEKLVEILPADLPIK
ncbi:MAG: DUF4236 domain-containing protein [Paludibacteraceae bacterium]|nr:DUF4236 domain-containing protein [Paludibacteraceae bacterium]